MSLPSLQVFLQQCKVSSESAYSQFKELLKHLEDEPSQKDALLLLNELKKNSSQFSIKQDYFRLFTQPIITKDEKSQLLWLFQFPSTFEPEAWSFTFYEGLTRYSFNEFNNKRMIELGCGIGWITIAMAKRYLPNEIFGVDINPKAIICAKLNLYLNAFDDQGQLIIAKDGKSLLERVSFAHSDLLNIFSGKENYFDHIIGCIPQVLNPEPKIMENLVAESSNDDYLLSLSNYCAMQGYIEDQFGLGLIAKAVEQSIPLVKPDGKLILNLGGRPGSAVLKRLMHRRGLNTRKIWQTWVEQAADTEIDALVDIEESVGHKFEFFLEQNQYTPVTAKTAAAYAKTGGLIYHSVDVYEAKLNYPDSVKSIYQYLNEHDNKKLKSAIDLSIERAELAEERYSFIAYLANWLRKIDAFPYENTLGLNYFKQQIREFLNFYHNIYCLEKQIVISPGRQELWSNYLNSLEQGDVLIDDESRLLLKQSQLTNGINFIEVPTDIEMLIKLVEHLKPTTIITRVSKDQINSLHLIEQLISITKKWNCYLILDISEHVNLSSEPESHAVYRWLSKNNLPAHVLINIALVHNDVYNDLSVNIALTSNTYVRKVLENAAELTYSRTPVLNQVYYAHLLEELLFFQRTRIQNEGEPVDFSQETMSLRNNVQQAFSHPAITGIHLEFNTDTIRLDYGENELPAPEILKESILESFLLHRISEDEASPEMILREHLQRRFNLPKIWYADMVFGGGVAAIYSGLLKQCADENQTLYFPTGAYGYFVAAADFHSVPTKTLETEETNGYKITADKLKQHFSNHPASWFFLNAPVVNPTGAIYSSDEINALLTVTSQYKGTLIIDSIFAGLEFEHNGEWNLYPGFSDIISTETARAVMINGLAKEYAAGGLRFGFAWSTDVKLMASLQQTIIRPPHSTLGYAARELLETHLNSAVDVDNTLDKQKHILKDRAQRLGNLLTQNGWKVIEPEGGLFIVAKPQAWIDNQTESETVVADKVAKTLFEIHNIAINNASWTGLPGYCRFVLSVSDYEFEKAIKRLEQFTVE